MKIRALAGFSWAVLTMIGCGVERNAVEHTSSALVQSVGPFESPEGLVLRFSSLTTHNVRDLTSGSIESQSWFIGECEAPTSIGFCGVSAAPILSTIRDDANRDLMSDSWKAITIETRAIRRYKVVRHDDRVRVVPVSMSIPKLSVVPQRLALVAGEVRAFVGTRAELMTIDVDDSSRQHQTPYGWTIDMEAKPGPKAGPFRHARFTFVAASNEYPPSQPYPLNVEAWANSSKLLLNHEPTWRGDEDYSQPFSVPIPEGTRILKFTVIADARPASVPFILQNLPITK